jgi:RNA polymerase-binding transcription factor DksA
VEIVVLPLLDIDPDIDDATYGWCRFCEHNVRSERRDHGIGRYEYQGYKGVHVDMRDCCRECGEEVGPERQETEQP